MASPLRTPPIVTLLTDFGSSDTFVGVMKGVILGIAPEARIVDLTHDIAPQRVIEAGLKLESAIRYFPKGAIHVAVVDPGVGTDRDAIVVETADAIFVAPDNGLLAYTLETSPPLALIRMGRRASELFLQPTSATFHGRDIFAPVAAHLANGVPLDRLIDPNVFDAPDSYVRLEAPTPTVLRRPNGGVAIRAETLYVDRFGNAISNVSFAVWQSVLREAAPNSSDEIAVTLTVGGATIDGISRTFGDVAEGSPVAYWGSAGRLEIGVRGGSLEAERHVTSGSVLHITVATRRDSSRRFEAR